jgi:hypothetical protein
MATDILAQLKEINDGLDETDSIIHKGDIKTPAEVTGVEPTADDLDLGPPPEAAPNTEMPPETPGEATEIPPETNPAEIGVESQEQLEEPDADVSDEELGLAGVGDIASAPEQPKERSWEPVPPPDRDMKSITFRSNKEGIFLDMKRLDGIPNLWLARLYQGDKLIDHGQILIPKDIKDPITYIQELANAMLDNKSMRYEQEWQQYYAAQRAKKEGVAPPATPEELPKPENLLSGEVPTEDTVKPTIEVIL